jgi:hypothetical protein
MCELYLVPEEDVECSVLPLFKRQDLKIQEILLGIMCPVNHERNFRISKYINRTSYTKIGGMDMNSVEINLFCLFTFPLQLRIILAYFLMSLKCAREVEGECISPYEVFRAEVVACVS